MVIALQIIGGLLLLFIGGESLIKGAVSLAKSLGMSTFIIGLTVVAYGTSSPELMISIQSALSGHPDIALGNVVGSNIANILCVLGLTALIYPIAIDKKISMFDMTFLCLITILLYGLCFLDALNQIAGIILIAILIFYTYLIFKRSKSGDQNLSSEQQEEVEEQLKTPLNLWQASAICIASFALLIIGSDILIEGSVSLARLIGISEATIGVTLVAFGGSAPELVVSIMAAIHKRSEIVFGNIIGSNLFNILGAIGITSLLHPINVDPRFVNFDLLIATAVTLILFAIIYFAPKIYRIIGAVFFASYIAYIMPQFL